MMQGLTRPRVLATQIYTKEIGLADFLQRQRVLAVISPAGGIDNR